MRKLILVSVLTLALAVVSAAQISGVGQFGCSGAPVTGTVWNSSTSLNSTQVLVGPTSAAGATVVLDQTTTITGGAVTFQADYGDGNFVSVPAFAISNPASLAQISNPYTLVASTNQAFFFNLAGIYKLQLKLTTALTGTGSITPFTTSWCGVPIVGPANEALLAGTAFDTNSGTKSAGTQRVVLATDQPALTNKLLVTPDSVALPANQSTNVAQVAGTTADTNSGVKSAGTLRVVLATDQPALTNKLLVTPDSVALPANQSVNAAQINGVTPLMGNGVTGTGSPRVTIASDNTAFSVNAAQATAANLNMRADHSGATGAAPPARAAFVGGIASGATGGFVQGITACDLSKPVNISTATTTLMVTGVSGRQVRICAINLLTAAANNVAIVEGTGATCGTGTAGVNGGTTAASGWNFAANGGLAQGSGLGEIMTTATTGDSVCIITSAGTQLSGFIKYTIY